MPSVETSRSDSILTVTINRPEARNAVVCVRTGFRAMSNGGSPPKRPYATNTGVAWRCSAAAKLRQGGGESSRVVGGAAGAGGAKSGGWAEKLWGRRAGAPGRKKGGAGGGESSGRGGPPGPQNALAQRLPQ